MSNMNSNSNANDIDGFKDFIKGNGDSKEIIMIIMNRNHRIKHMLIWGNKLLIKSQWIYSD